ncbi:MAG: serine/threonine protein phosphatase [Asgard group archaeon]|nr:serine/threonine protein phosphatase [Asgard group archaeon]
MIPEEILEIIDPILADFKKAKELSEVTITTLIDYFILKNKNKKMLKRIKSGNMLIVGDIHGDFNLMTEIIEKFLSATNVNHLIFLGDIVDRGSNSIACLNLLFSLMIRHPEKVHLIRGNHEEITVNMRYGFLEEVKRFTNFVDDGSNSIFLDYFDSELKNLPALYIKFNNAFSVLPFAIIHEKSRYFFVHGGIPKDICSLEEISDLPKGLVVVKHPLVYQLLWNDPTTYETHYGYNIRGQGCFTYGPQLVEEFLEKNNLKKIIRAHQVFEDGYQSFFDDKLLSLFTSEEHYTMVDAKIAFIIESGGISLFHPTDEIEL